MYLFIYLLCHTLKEDSFHLSLDSLLETNKQTNKQTDKEVDVVNII